jgi:hypothetical protein
LTAIVILATAMLQTACSSPTNADGQERALPRAPAVLKVTMADFYFVHPNRAPAGRVVFEINNAGRFVHQLTIYRMAEDSIPFKQQFRKTAYPVEVPIENMPALRPDESGSFAVDLVAGARYGMASLLFGPDGTNDAQNGMSSEFRAGGRATG